MADELESFSPLTDAEKDAIWGAGAYGASAWGTDITKEVGTTYQGNPSVKIVDDGTLHSGFAYRDKIPVGNSSVMRMWIAINVPACLTNSIMWGMLRYDTSGALVDAIATDSDAEDYDDAAWHVLQSSLAIGGNAYVRPFVSIEGSITTYVGMMDAQPMPVMFSAYATSQRVEKETVTKIQFDQELYDYGSCYDAAANYRFTAPLSGIYLVQAQMFYSSVAATTHASWLFLEKNGDDDYLTLDKGYMPGAGSFFPLQGAMFVPLIAGDYLEVNVLHYDSDHLHTWGSVAGGQFSVMMLR